METAELDNLKLNFQRALEGWVCSIQRLQEVLTETSHSVRSEDIWRQADFAQEDAQKTVKDARQAYEDAVRKGEFWLLAATASITDACRLPALVIPCRPAYYNLRNS